MLIEAKDDGGGGDNWTTGAISRAKLQPNHHHQQTNIQFFYRPDALPVIQPTVSKHWRENITFLDSFTPSSPGVFQLCLWPLIVPGYHGGGLPCLSSVLWCQYPVTVSYYWFKIFMACTDCVLKSWPPCCRMQPCVSSLHTCTSVTKHYNWY